MNMIDEAAMHPPSASPISAVAVEASAATSDAPRRISVIIANYNYARYVGESISSALNLDWPDVEVIVVNNGSTDNSSEVIATFGDRIRTVQLQVNCGNLGACNIGYAMSSGDVIYFLDADDVVEPEMMREVAAVWSSRLSKVQFQSRIIDGQGEPTGGYFPQYHVVPSSAELRDMARTIGNYAGPNCLGNIYARSFLQRIFPLKPEAGPYSDSCCIAAAPYLGEIVVLPKPLARYRVHGTNSYAMLAIDRNRFTQMLEIAIDLFGYSRQIAASVGIEVEPNAIDRSMHTLAVRVASLRLAPLTHPVPGDTRLRVARLLLSSMRYPQGLRWRQKAMTVAWGLATLIAPARWAERLVSWRFAPSTRPWFLGRALRLSGVLKS